MLHLTSVEYARVLGSFNSMLIADYCSIAATTFLFYEYFVTFANEVECIWCRKFTGATVLFALNRYAVLLQRALVTVQMLPWQSWHPEIIANQICIDLVRLTEGLGILIELTITCIMSLRMYAIWLKDRRILTMILVLGCVSPAINIYCYYLLTIGSVPQPLTGCGYYIYHQAAFVLQSNLTLVHSIFIILYNSIILLLTIMRTIGIMRQFSRLQIRTPLVTLLLRDGSIYFVLLVVFNIIYLFSLRFQPSLSYTSAIGDVVTSIIISRLLLNLRGLYPNDDLDTKSQPSHISKFSGINFARNIVGNLGAPLNTRNIERSLEDDDGEQGSCMVEETSSVGWFPSGIRMRVDGDLDENHTPSITVRSTWSSPV